MDSLGVPLIRAVPDYVIEGEDVITISVGGQDFCSFFIDDFERGSAKAARVIAKHRAGRFPRERGIGAATLN
jgi:hypothetical protein